MCKAGVERKLKFLFQPYYFIFYFYLDVLSLRKLTPDAIVLRVFKTHYQMLQKANIQGLHIIFQFKDF